MSEKRKKGGFFSETDDTAEELFDEEAVVSDEPKPEATVSGKKIKERVTVKKAVIALSLLAVLILGIVAYLIPKDDLANTLTPPEGGNNAPYKPILFIEDWDANIFEEEAYLSKVPDRIEYRDGGNMRVLFEDTIKDEEEGLVFVNEYLNAIKRGDHEAVNAMYTKNCLEREDIDGNKLHKKHDKFPMQRIFEIKIKKVYPFEYKEEGDEELSFDGVLYDVKCPVCGEEITFDEDTLSEGSIECPKCGERLEFDLSGETE